MFPSLLIIGAVAFVLGFLVNRLSPEERSWFNRLRRPSWLTFEWAIPFIWIFIFTCGVISANEVWQKSPQNLWLLMLIYALWEVSILAYTSVMCKFRSLTVGVIIGAIGMAIGLILAILVFPISQPAGWLLVPFLLWSPIGTLVTWQMIGLNPGSA
jgi:tryptophan-rich sensory protein